MKTGNDVLTAVQEQMTSGHFDRAVQICRQQLVSSPSDVPLLALLTLVCERTGDMGQAREVASRWVEAAPLDAHAHYRLAMIEQRLQNYGAAMQRLAYAADFAGSDEHVARAADEAMTALDAVQLQQIIALRDVDYGFQVRLRLTPEQALGERGFALTDNALRQLILVSEGSSAEYRPRPPRPS